MLEHTACAAMLGTHVAHACLRAIDTIFLAVGNNKRRLHMSIQQRESVHCNVCTSSTFASLCAWHTPTLSFQNRPPALAQPGGGPLQKGSDANTTRRFRPNDPLSLAAARRLQQYGCSWARLGTGTCRADGGVSCCPGRESRHTLTAYPLILCCNASRQDRCAKQVMNQQS